MTPTVLTIILNWRTPGMTLQAAEAALREMEGIAGEITIVDNDSGDGSFEMLTEEVARRGWSRVRVLQSGRNGGFGAGNNFGIRAGLRNGARPDYVYILNSDAFPDTGAIRALIDHLETHPDTGFAGSYIHGPDGEAHLTSFRFPSIASEFEGAARTGPISRMLGSRAVPIPVPDRTSRVDWLAGASLMMRMDVLDRIGLFDETFFLYFEETDLCLRAAKAGFPTDYVRDSSVTHIGSASTGMQEWKQVPDYWFHSRLYYFRKNHGWFGAWAATKAHIAGGLIHRLRAGLTGKRPVDPPGFLRRLIAHDTAALLRPTTRRADPPRASDPTGA
ncbi:MAG: glycosyltransferase family 2 protein [Rubellimicrobium sp.]|nr:glycosyltransferase family 2 protein [Rubellimicrobium sp.]